MEGRLINVRKLVALDITLHGPRFIIAEFGIGTPLILAVGLGLMLSGQSILGVHLVLTGINYLPLLVYSIIIVKGNTADKEVAYDLANNKHYIRKYSVQQLLIFLPFVVLLLALMQKTRKNQGKNPPP